MSRLRRFLGSLAGRFFLILTLGLVTATTLALTFADLERRSAETADHAARAAQRISDYAGGLAVAPVGLRQALLEGPRPVGFHPPPDAPELGKPDADLNSRITPLAGMTIQAFKPSDCPRPPAGPPPPPQPAGARAAPPPPPKPPAPPAATDCRLVVLTFADGAVVRLLVDTPPIPKLTVRAAEPAFLIPLVLAAAALSFLLARMAAAPVARLATAADGLAENLDRPPLAEDGPMEVAGAARAFNRMQAALQANLRERIQMLAAISHDLRTPITRMRLRAEKVAEPDLRQALIADAQAMGDLVEDGLDLARATADAEPQDRLDLDALLSSLVEDAADAGVDATYAPRLQVSVITRAGALRRCIANLLDNALRYGGSARVTAVREGDAVRVIIRDHGPGIDPARLETVFEPFVRLETSRSRDTGGAGLGLTIARALGRKAGAVVSLRNAEDGGLEASVLIARVRR